MLTPYYDAHGITLYCGNSLELLPMLAGEKVTFVYSDPPYGINAVNMSGVLSGRESAKGFVGGGREYNFPFGGIGDKRRSKQFSRPNYKEPIQLGKYAPVIGDDTTKTAVCFASLCLEQWNNAVQVWWGGNYYADALPASSCWIVWDKQNTGDFADAELAWTNQKTAVRIFKHMWNGLLKASERGESRIHPTQKPILLADFCFRKYGKPTDLILDPFAGSGSAAAL